MEITDEISSFFEVREANGDIEEKINELFEVRKPETCTITDKEELIPIQKIIFTEKVSDKDIKVTLEEYNLIRSKQIARKKRHQHLTIKDYTLKNDEILIPFGELMQTVHSPITVKLGSFMNSPNIETSLKFDKNLNILTSSSLYRYNPDSHDLPVISESHFRSGNDGLQNKSSFIVINKKKFFDSKGEVISIKQFYGVSHKVAISIAKEIKRRFKNIKSFLSKLREIIDEVYDEELFEIIINTKDYSDITSFSIDIVFPEVTLKNSQNQSYYLGTMVVRTTGKYYSETDKFSFDYILEGHRLSWTLRDIRRHFAHSHLPSSREGIYYGFCVGEGSVYDSIVDEVNPPKEQIQSFLLTIDSFIRWESLEGGPYQRFSQRPTVTRLRKKADDFSITNRYYNYDQEKLKELISFETVSSAFKLVRERNELRYIVDEETFIEIVVEEISNRLTGDRFYHLYDTENKIFLYSLHGTVSENNSPKKIEESLLKEADELFARTPHTYINGKLIKSFHDSKDPWMKKKEKDEEKKDENVLIPTLQPESMLVLAYEYLYKLNKKLKDVKKQKLEQ
jgi:hypothetical protein